MRPLRILDLRDTYEIGGPGKTILETYRAIDATRFELHVGVFLTRRESEESPFVTAAKAQGMPVHLIRGFNQYDPRMVWRLVKLVDKLGIDIVHAHEVKSDFIAYAASKVRRVPIVTTLHGWIGNSARRRLMNALDVFIVRRFDRVIAVSAPIHERLAAGGVSAERLRLLHNAIVIERYRRTGSRGSLAALLGRPIGSPVIATIGRISPEKGQMDLIEALAVVTKLGYQVSAVLAGDGPSREGLAQRIRDLGLEGSVHLPGYVSQPQRILEETDLMVLPSHTEGLPNAALEALAMEVPVLATRVGGTPEVVTDGETGRLVEPRSPDALARSIIEFLTDPAPWKRMAKRGREQVEARFDFQKRTDMLEAIYLELGGAR